ncbi:MAG: hypothetical protein KDK36_21040 [Leptospiraceae bacterium]|nr:hypothetical protein [Leptospiraceae bacterium]
MFGILDKNSEEEKAWLYKRDMNETAKDFEKIYRKYINDLNFKKCLYKFLGKDQDKHYWIALFLYLEDYTKINDQILAEHILNRSIRSFTINCEFSYEKDPESYGKCAQLTSAHAMLGYLHWLKGNKMKSEHHFKIAEEFESYNPGGWPALGEKEMNEIRKEFNLK